MSKSKARAERELFEANRLRSWIYAQQLPVEQMAQMLADERAGLEAQIDRLERRAGLDLGRVFADTVCGVAIGVLISLAVARWLLS